MNILILTTAIPVQYGTGADIASQHFIDAIKSLGHSVTVVGYQRPGQQELPPNEVTIVGERYIETKEAGWYAMLWALSALIRQLPYSSAKYYSTQYIQIVKALLSERHYHAIILDHSSQLCWIEPILAGYRKPIILAHNLEHEIFWGRVSETQNLLMKWVYQREAWLARKVENYLAANAAGIWTLTQHDANYFSSLANSASIKAFGLPSTSIQPIDPSSEKNFDVGMIGNWFWKPNGDGLQWFFEQVYPHLPDSISIQVAGRGADWLQGRYPNVVYRGFVENAQAFLAQAQAVVIPSIRGGGIQIKTLEAIGSGLPIIATPFALRGIAEVPATVHSAESPIAFANCIQSAIAVPPTSANIESVRVWARDRRNKFLHDVEMALMSL